MNSPRNESLSFPPAEPPPFPDVPPVKKTMPRRKLAALVGALPLGAVAVGSVFLGRDSESGAGQGGSAAATPANDFGAVPTRTAPAAGTAPEIARIGSRHIAALHAIHNYMSHISTYAPNTLDDYFAGAIAATTGACRQELIDTKSATQNYLFTTNSRSEVLEFNCGLRAITGTTALGVGYVKQSTSSDLDPTPAVSLTATVVTAEEQPDGRWLVSDMKRIST
ncbi:hypothetical protein JK358_18695 [Nocardia sp. 2]|uniref:Mce-associated membrane protein n=1 Tax=Nocardia acididurans TaxID=2802282 RepID=A0ABS1M726_9NOCA|nr:hypothetical protein [Nocardia acididurans]MBL1076430.1 hypothetical protein [Nocardia acididurans]